MILKITECEGTDAGRGLLRDLADYPTVPELARAVMDGRTAFRPLSFGVRCGGKGYGMRRDGEDQPGVADMIKKLRGKTGFPNDDIVIKADIFESELYIYMDGEDF